MTTARPTTLRAAALLVALLAVAAGCGGDGEPASTGDTAVDDATTTTVDAGARVTSDDEVVTLTIPDGALPAGTTLDDLAVTRLDPIEVPEAIAATDDLLGAYSLEPDGLVFAAPVTISWTLDGEPAGPTPFVALATSAADGTDLALAGDPHVVVADGEVTATGTIEHFSSAYAFSSSVRASLPPSVTVPTGEPGKITVDVTRGSTVEASFELTLDVDIDPSVTVDTGGSASNGSDDDIWFTCTRPGRFPYTVRVTLDERVTDVFEKVAVLAGIVDPVSATVELTGVIVCEGEPDEDAGPDGSPPELMELIAQNPTSVDFADGGGIAALFVDDATVSLALYREAPLDFDLGDCLSVRSEVQPPSDPALLADVLHTLLLGDGCAGPTLPPDQPSVDVTDERVRCAVDGKAFLLDLGPRTSDDGRPVTRGFVGILADHGVGLVSTAVVELDATQADLDEVLLDRLQPYLITCR